eukprot:7649668-Pyramimonas_sp.AAC.1
MQGRLPPTILVVDVVPLAPMLLRLPLGLQQRVDALLQDQGRWLQPGRPLPPPPPPRQVILEALPGLGAPRKAAPVTVPGQNVVERRGRDVPSAFRRPRSRAPAARRPGSLLGAPARGRGAWRLRAP